MSQLTNENDKEYLVRCLGVKGFFEATDTLIKEFKSSSNNTYKWAIGNSLSLIEDKNQFKDYIEIVMDKKHGTVRQMVIEVIGKFKDKRAVSLLLKLLEDKDVLGHALIALSNFKDPKLIPYVEPFLYHQVSWIRHTAKRIIEKIEKLKIK